MEDMLWLKAVCDHLGFAPPCDFYELALAKARLYNREMIYQITGDRDMPWQRGA